MANKERLLPDNTMGGRIQKQRLALGYDRCKLYDLVYEISEKSSRAGKDESKKRVIKDWESGNHLFDLPNIYALCKALQCSSDYLLGLDECTNKTNQFIHDQTGLSEDSINSIKAREKYAPRNMAVLDSLLSSHSFMDDLLTNLDRYGKDSESYYAYHYAAHNNKNPAATKKDIAHLKTKASECIAYKAKDKDNIMLAVGMMLKEIENRAESKIKGWRKMS